MKDKAEPFQKLCTRMRLWEFPDEFVIQPTDGSSASAFSICLVDASLKLIDRIPESSSIHVPRTRLIFGVVGMLKLATGSYLFVVTDRKCVGSYLGHPIFKVMSLKVLPCAHSVKNSPAEQKRVENEFSRLLKTAERTTGLYFSYDTTLTLSAQRLYDLGDESKMLPLWRQEEPRFLWNSYMLEALIDKKLDPYLLPVVQGSFHNFRDTIGKEIVDVTLIARRCTRRNGSKTRLVFVPGGAPQVPEHVTWVMGFEPMTLCILTHTTSSRRQNPSGEPVKKFQNTSKYPFCWRGTSSVFE